MKIQKLIFYISLLLVILGCLLPLYKIDDSIEHCSILTIIALIFNCLLIGYLYFKNKKYIGLTIIPMIVSLIYFIIIWADISDKFSIMSSLEIKYKYCIGFYFLLSGTFLSIIIYIVYLRKLIPVKEKVKVTYTANKKTGSIERHEIRD